MSKRHFAEDPLARVALGALVLWAVLILPWVRDWFEASMFRQMILQLPLLFFVGWYCGKWLGALRAFEWVQCANRWGATGMLLALVIMTLWMLPRLLDSAQDNGAWMWAKFLSVPILVGCAASVSWRLCPAIARGVIHMEIVATFWRFGWGYAAAEDRLCLSYLLGDQQRTGTALCAIGALWAAVVVWKPLFGSPRTEELGAGLRAAADPNESHARRLTRKMG